MSPTILRKGSVAENNEEIIAIGSPGGSMIPAVLVPVLFDMTMFGESMQAAVDKLRVVVKSANSLLVEVGEAEAPPWSIRQDRVTTSPEWISMPISAVSMLPATAPRTAGSVQGQIQDETAKGRLATILIN